MLLQQKLKNKRIILASASPRRQYLLKEMGLNFEVQVREIEESFPFDLKAEKIPLFLCKKKADTFSVDELHDTILITADTIVWLNNEVLEKPANSGEAEIILKKLSGKMHEVITAVCIKSKDKESLFFSSTLVYFKELLEEEIKYYIDVYQPYDKAGAYGIQEWIGMIGVPRIEGSYFTVMGLPMHKLYNVLLNY